MQATFNLIANPFHPLRDRVQKPITRKLSINTIIKRQKVDLSRPTICYYNGKPLLRKFWQNTRVGDGDVVSFIYLPQGGGGGGGGSNAMRIVMMIVIAVAAYYTGYWAAGAYGGMGTAAGAAAGFAASTAVSIAGNMLMNALIPPPKPPSSESRGGASPTYSLAAQGNFARIGQPIPVVYGKHVIYPDFAAMPYIEFENDDQYLYQLFCVGQGEYEFDLAKMKVEDSPLSDFPEIQYEICPPGVPVTLFPTQVITSPEVSGQELTGGTVGPFVLNPAETQVSKIAVDVSFPAGLCAYDDDDGDREAWKVTVETFATPIDDYGVATGPEVMLGTHETRAATPKAVRRTFKYDVAPGRYKVRINRTKPKSTSSNIVDSMIWASLRGYLVGGTDTYEDVTMLAVKMKAEQSISQQSSRKINVEVTRKLPVPSWNVTTQMWDWSAPQPTRSPAWALADIFRAKYGGATTDNRIDVSQLLALNATCVARNDYFDGIFDNAVVLWEAATSVCRAARTRPFIQSGLVHFVRDQLTTLPTALFTSRNIVKNSFKISYVMPSEDTADCVDVEYLDRNIWKPRTIRCALQDSLSQKPAQIKAFGITTREQAWREGMYMAASNKYRRKEISFETELEGHVPSLGDLIAVQSDIPEWGQAGDIVAVNGFTLNTSEPMTWTEGATHYMMLRRPDGSGWGPSVVFRGINDSQAILDGVTPLDFTIQTDGSMERTHYAFGRSGQVVQLARITSIKPRSDRVQIACINEDSRVHSADETAIPPDTFLWSLSAPSMRPILSDFDIVQTGSGSTPTVTLSWTPTVGASRYVIETSYDNDLGAGNWIRLAETTTTSYSFLAPVTEGRGLLGPIHIRVAAFGGMIGPWVSKTFTPGAVPPPPNVVAGTISASGTRFEFKWTAVGAADGYVVEVLSEGMVKRSVKVVDPSYVYSWEQAIYDGGPWRTITMRVKASKGGVLSQVWYAVESTNAAPAAPTVAVRVGVKSLGVDVSPCNEADYVGTMIWGSTDSAFVPGPTNLLYAGPGYFYMKTDITAGMYFKAAHYDTYGTTGLNISGAAYGVPTTAAGVTTVTTLPASPAEVDGQNAIFLENADPDIQGIYGWDGTQWIRVGGLTPGSVGTNELAAGAVDYTKLAAGAVQARNLAVKKHFLY